MIGLFSDRQEYCSTVSNFLQYKKTNRLARMAVKRWSHLEIVVPDQPYVSAKLVDSYWLSTATGMPRLGCYEMFPTSCQGQRRRKHFGLCEITGRTAQVVYQILQIMAHRAFIADDGNKKKPQVVFCCSAIWAMLVQQ